MWNQKVIWYEGMLLHPVHFQQHMRSVERLVEARSGAVANHAWGLSALKIDEPMLLFGKVGIREARGLFPDGTPFHIPDDTDPPAPVELPGDARDTVVYLSLPVRRAGMLEVTRGDDADGFQDGLERYLAREYEVRDSNAWSRDAIDLEVGTLIVRLMLNRFEEHVHIGIARVVETRPDGRVVLDDAYVPTVLDCAVAPPLADFAHELQGLLHHRGNVLAARISAMAEGGTVDPGDLLMLQCLNRFEPLMAHLKDQGPLHPETLYRLAVLVAGELATFTRESRRAGVFPTYDHGDLQGSFAPVMAELRRSLGMILVQNATRIPLEVRDHGVLTATMDRSLLQGNEFVLAVSAKAPPEQLLEQLPAQVTIAPVEAIRRLVDEKRPGIAARPLPVAPPQLPYEAGCAYFELDRASEHWAQLGTSGGWAIHVDGDIPGLKLEFWAVRR